MQNYLCILTISLPTVNKEIIIVIIIIINNKTLLKRKEDEIAAVADLGGADGGNCPPFTMKIQLWRPLFGK